MIDFFLIEGKLFDDFVFIFLTVSPFIDLDDIAEVRAGHGTDTFNLAVKQHNSKLSGQAQQNANQNGAQKAHKLPPLEDACVNNVSLSRNCCFSLIFKGETPPLDLIAEDQVIILFPNVSRYPGRTLARIEKHRCI